MLSKLLRFVSYRPFAPRNVSVLEFWASGYFNRATRTFLPFPLITANFSFFVPLPCDDLPSRIYAAVKWHLCKKSSYIQPQGMLLQTDDVSPVASQRPLRGLFRPLNSSFIMQWGGSLRAKELSSSIRSELHFRRLRLVLHRPQLGSCRPNNASSARRALDVSQTRLTDSLHDPNDCFTPDFGSTVWPLP